MNDPNRIAWNKMGEEAAKRCGGNLKLYSAKFAEVRQEHEAKKARALAKYSLRDNPSTGAWRVYADSSDVAVEVEVADSRNLTRLSNLILGLPRRADNQIDLPLAVAVVNQSFSDLARLSCGDYLSAEAMRLMRSKNVGPGNLTTPDVYGSLYSQCLQAAKAANPEVTAVYNGAQVSEGALTTICWPIIKPVQSAEQYTRRYSAADDHVKYDSSGNQYRKYDL